MYRYFEPKTAFLIILIFIVGVTIFTSGGSLQKSPLYPAQYSDANITENAKIKDERFEHVAFSSSPERGKTFVPDQLANVFRAFKSLFSSKDKPKEEYGTWVWTPILQMTPDYMQSIVRGAKAEGVNVIYLSIDSYLDIYTLEASEEKEMRKQEFSNILNQFILLANQNGIQVDAEAGWRNWAEDGHTYKAFAIVEFVKDFNQKHSNKFRGFQYDVEPYLLSQYQESVEGKRLVLRNFMKLVDETLYYLSDTDLKLAVVVPEFYDKRDKATPKFEYSDRKDFAFGHLLYILEKKPGSSIIIMSYRNFAEGPDGSIEVSKNELKTAKRGQFATNIILAQETGDVLPSYVTFYNMRKDYFLGEIGKLESAFSSHRNFAGLAIHYANAYLKLK